MMAAMTPRPLAARAATFLRSLLTGAMATLADMAVIGLAIGVFGLTAKQANLPALLIGAGVQFVGNRQFAFRGARAGSLRKQAALFAATEVVGLTLNWVLYFAAASAFHLNVATAVIARAITTNLVFLGWSYPVWTRVFRGTREGHAA